MREKQLDIKFVIGEVSTTDGKRYLLLSCESGETGDVEVLELNNDVDVLEALGYEIKFSQEVDP